MAVERITSLARSGKYLDIQIFYPPNNGTNVQVPHLYLTLQTEQK